MSTTIRITYVRRADRYRLDEVDDHGVVRTEISPAVLDDKAFAEYLAALVADYRRLEVSRGAIDDDGPTTRSPQPSRREQREVGS